MAFNHVTKIDNLVPVRNVLVSLFDKAGIEDFAKGLLETCPGIRFFSTGGTSVRLIRPYFSPAMITFMRFLVGVGWLLLLKAVLRKPFRADFRAALRAHWKWLVFGAVSKFLS